MNQLNKPLLPPVINTSKTAANSSSPSNFQRHYFQRLTRSPKVAQLLYCASTLLSLNCALSMYCQNCSFWFWLWRGKSLVLTKDIQKVIFISTIKVLKTNRTGLLNWYLLKLFPAQGPEPMQKRPALQTVALWKYFRTISIFDWDFPFYVFFLPFFISTFLFLI